MVFNDRPTCKDRHAAELILARSTRLHQRPNTLPQTCLLAQTNPCSHAADHTIYRYQSMSRLVRIGDSLPSDRTMLAQLHLATIRPVRFARAAPAECDLAQNEKMSTAVLLLSAPSSFARKGVV